MLESSNSQWQQEAFKCGNTIVSDVDILWLIHQGLVKTSTWDEKGKSIVLGYWGIGDVVGQSLSRIKPYKIECLTYVTATCVHYRSWHYLRTAIFRHQQDTEELLYIFRHKTLRQRVIKSLIFLARKFGIKSTSGRTSEISLTHQELADFIGTHRPCVTKVINQLEQDGLIERPTRSYIILNSSLIRKTCL